MKDWLSVKFPMPLQAVKHNLSVKEAFQYLFQFKGIEFIKENYEVEHTLSFDTVLEDIGILCRRNGGML